MDYFGWMRRPSSLEQAIFRTLLRARRNVLGPIFIIFLLFLLFGEAALGAAHATPTESYRMVHTYPHDAAAFTQGLVFVDGMLYESTGLNG